METLEEAKSQGQALDGSDAKKLADFLLEHLWKRNDLFFLRLFPFIHTEHSPVFPVSGEATFAVCKTLMQKTQDSHMPSG